MSLRTTVVGAVIWGVMGFGVAVLVFAIARRLWQRLRRGRAPDPEEPPAQPEDEPAANAR